ncbi:MAG: hypothetical protein SOZ80_02365 [Prevotella sp.]|uniref:hypothetical protein n=1 Tax=Prevotella sp. TaxID=59823 RepID=UPI002A28D6EF|nr:hypothetical protein [Prevotella sp.]MDD7319113.1 hypothetical protein [Prevotellaceae bacterium]MDY4019612.1 hypothetical protein [Prevotella sp.]
MKKTFIAIFTIAAILTGMNSCTGKKSGDEVKATDSIGTADTTENAFNYTPAEPVNGKLKAVVELGAAGFNLFVINVDENKNWKSEKKEFGTSLIAENATNAEEVKTKLEEYIKKIVEYGVDGKSIHFVVSSGAAKEPIIVSIEKALKEIGYVVNKVTPEQEAEYAFMCVLPQSYENKAYVVDMGSGNTKLSYKSQGQMVTKETYGAKYFKKNIDKATVYDDVKTKFSDVPAANQETLFIIGGVPFQMAKMLKKGDERYTVLSTNLTDYDKLAQEEGEKVVAGLNIYKGVLDATSPKQVVFDWDANFTIGFLLALPY